MLAETIAISTALLLITLIISATSLRRGLKPIGKKTVPQTEKVAEYVTRDKFTEWKSTIESRMKAVETQWDDTYAKMRRKEARYMRESKFDEKADGPAVTGDMLPPMTGEELEKAHNRMKLGL